MSQRPLTLALLGLMLVPVLAFRFGGWAVVTVDDLPEYLVAGKPVTLSFVVRQHGVTPLDGLKPRLTIRNGSDSTSVMAMHASGRGQYAATMTAPRAGEWSVRIESGFMNAERTLLPIRAIAVGGAPPRALADAERGHQLFIAKDCVTCHVRGADSPRGGSPGPDLTGKRYPVDYVAKFLADPESSPLSRTTQPNGLRMPKLDLKEREIASLVAFLNSEAPVLGKAVGKQ